MEERNWKVKRVGERKRKWKGRLMKGWTMTIKEREGVEEKWDKEDKEKS